jgi:thiamine-monophosphate kinase
MPLGEFDLIARYFTRAPKRATLGIGDDCALLAPLPAGQQLAISSDMLVEGRHFLSTVAPDRLGHKALAVNLSDLAACGAEPIGFTLALSMPRVDETFLEGFARGMFALADAHDIELVGGDTTAGPLNICITVFGALPSGQALLRSGARAGDELWVSGRLGDARLALEVFRGIDANTALQHECLLAGGDDYELLFSARGRRGRHAHRLHRGRLRPAHRRWPRRAPGPALHGLRSLPH